MLEYELQTPKTLSRTTKKGNVMETFIKVIGLAALGFVIVTFIGLLLWNDCLVPAVAGVKEIGWLQAWGLMILFGFLFKTTTTNRS